MSNKSSNNYKCIGDIGCERKVEEEKEISEISDISDISSVSDHSEDSESEDEPLSVSVIENYNPCVNSIYDPTRVQFNYIHDDDALIAIRKGVCFRCSAYRQVMFINLCDNYNCSQMCERCISDMFNDARN